MPKRILHLRGSSSLLGAERVILELSQWSPTFGYEPLIVAPHESGAPTPEFVSAARTAGIEAMTLPCDGKLDWRFLLRLRRLVRSEGVDIIHSHGYKEDVHAGLAGLGVPLVATNHLWKRSTRALRLYTWVDALMLRRFNEIIAVSEAILSDLRRVGLPARKLSKIANGIDLRRFQPPPEPAARRALRESLGLRADSLAIGMLSSLTKEKGHRFALAAMAALREEFPQLQLCIVGDGPLRAQLEQEVAERELGAAVRFAGRRSDVAQVLGAFDIFLLPSLIEGLPMALLEAMAAGLPPVASAVGDVPQAVQDGVSGRLVPAGAPAELADALRELVTSEALRRRLGEGARQRVAEHFSSRAMARAYCQVYDRQLRANGATAIPRQA